MSRVRLRPDADGEAGVAIDFDERDGDLLPFLPRLIVAATQLIMSPEIRRVRDCGSETCDWLFLDTTKNRSRRWCSMSGCGNRAKAKRHYQRRRKDQQGTD
jgi:predicted RNA-binding Zn ribbon-like protein